MFNKKAFTLFELLVSISIIGILVAVASISYGAAQKKARDSRRMEDLNGIQKAAEQYYSSAAYTYPQGTNIATNWTINGQKMMEIFPSDPKGVIQYVYTPTASGYCACAAMEGTSAGNSSDNVCTFGSGNFYCVKSQQ